MLYMYTFCVGVLFLIKRNCTNNIVKESQFGKVSEVTVAKVVRCFGHTYDTGLPAHVRYKPTAISENNNNFIGHSIVHNYTLVHNCWFVNKKVI